MNEQMENAKALYKPASDATAKRLNDTAERDRRWVIMVALWERMGQFFGARWEREFGTVNDQTIHAWRGALNRFSEQEIASAVKACADWESPHPPNFPEFKALCMAARSKAAPTWTDDRLEAERDRARGGNPIAGALEKLGKRGLSDVAKAEIEKMRQIVTGEIDVPKAESWRHLGLDRIRGPLA